MFGETLKRTWLAMLMASLRSMDVNLSLPEGFIVSRMLIRGFTYSILLVRKDSLEVICVKSFILFILSLIFFADSQPPSSSFKLVRLLTLSCNGSREVIILLNLALR